MRNLLLPVLLACVLPAQAGQEPAADPPPTYEALAGEFAQARKEHNAALRAATESQDKEEVTRLRGANPAVAFTPRFAAGAKAHAGKPEAVPFLCWLTSNARAPEGSKALTELMEHHLQDPGIRLAVARIGTLGGAIGPEMQQKWLADVIAKNPDQGVVLQARFTRSAMHVGTRATVRSEQLRRQAVADLKLVKEQSGEASLRQLATGLLNEAERLEPGLPAPDIEGEDLDGVKFKLSDYRGKVVLLDFWGDW